MKKDDLKKLALLGIAGGLLFSAPSDAAQKEADNSPFTKLVASHGCGGSNPARRRRSNTPQYYPSPKEQSYKNAASNDYTGNHIMEKADNDEDKGDKDDESDEDDENKSGSSWY